MPPCLRLGSHGATVVVGPSGFRGSAVNLNAPFQLPWLTFWVHRLGLRQSSGFRLWWLPSLGGAFVGCFVSTPIALQNIRRYLDWTCITFLGNKSMCACLCLSLYVCMYVHVCMYMYVYIWICIYIYVYVVYAYMYFIFFFFAILFWVLLLQFASGAFGGISPNALS